MIDVNQMVEDVRSIKNDCDILLNLNKCSWEAEIRHLYPTILENIAVKAQDLIDAYCVTHG